MLSLDDKAKLQGVIQRHGRAAVVAALLDDAVTFLSGPGYLSDADHDLLRAQVEILSKASDDMKNAENGDYLPEWA